MTPADRVRGSIYSGRRRNPVLLVGLRLFGPYLLYTLLNARLHNELMALAVGAAIPLAFFSVLSIKHRRVDAPLALSALSLLVALAIAALIGHGSTVIKLRGAVAPAVFGLALLALGAGPARLRSRAVGALLGPGARRAEGQGGEALVRAVEPERRAVVAAHLRILMIMWGLGLVILSAAHVTIVLTVATSDYLVASHVASLGLVTVLILATRARRAQWAAAPTRAEADDSVAGARPPGVSGPVKPALQQSATDQELSGSAGERGSRGCPEGWSGELRCRTHVVEGRLHRCG